MARTTGKRATGESAKPASRSEKLEFVIEYRFPEVAVYELEDIETDINQGETLDEAIRAFMEEDGVSVDR